MSIDRSHVQTKPAPAARKGARSAWLWAASSVVLLALLLWGFVALDPLAPLTQSMPPVEELSIQRVDLGDYGFRLSVVNGGPQPVTISQVLVDEAYWQFSIKPDNRIPRLGEATIVVPYPWVEGEAHEILLLTTSGATFAAEVEVAVASPEPSSASWWAFGLLGLFVGVVPVALGLIWYPALQNLGRRGMNALLALTVGLLLFLLVDTVMAALEQATVLPETLEGGPLVWLVALAAFALLVAASRGFKGSPRPDTQNAGIESGLGGLRLATFIALGIGLHNLGEGLAIGAAFNVGEAALGSFLVVGFTIHNVTEGIGICAPILGARPRIKHFFGLAALAGGPAILGTWIGAFSYSAVAAVLFLAIGAGAIAQVIYEVGRLIAKSAARTGEPALSWGNFAGLAGGLLIMYATALLVAV